MQALIAEPAGPHTDARLFVARCERQIVAGALALRCGRSVHYFWGGTDRHFDKPFGGVAVHWGVMKWGIEQGLARYDLEGINPKSNPGVYQFKVRAGGEEVVLPGQVGYGLDWRGRWMLSLGRRLSRRPGRRGIGAE
jgi:lipid II:glycine glycyltransferase (peptidoglycan interpeptide bridge formation enzyme)